MTDALARRLDLRRRALEQAREAVDVVLGEAVEVVGDDGACDLALVRVFDRRQLQEQALGDAARADAGRIERLHALERDLHLDLLDGGRHAARLCELGQFDAQVAVVVERLDDRAGERVVALLERQDVDLAVQVLAQADVGGDHVERADVVVAALLAHARRRLLPVLALVGRVGDRRVASRSMPRGSPSPLDGADLDAAGVGRGVLDLEERIAPHRVLHFLGEVERGELQQAHRVLQSRRDRVLLSLSRLQGREVHRSIRSRVGKRAAQRGVGDVAERLRGSNTRAHRFFWGSIYLDSSGSSRMAEG
jgi:hypothetical protein